MKSPLEALRMALPQVSHQQGMFGFLSSEGSVPEAVGSVLGRSVLGSGFKLWNSGLGRLRHMVGLFGSIGWCSCTLNQPSEHLPLHSA